MPALTLSRRIAAAERPRATLVLLPSLGTSTHVWDPLLAALPDADRLDVLLFDLPGHGVAPAETGFTLTQLAVGTADAIAGAAVRAPVVVAGVSMGGAVAVEITRRSPDLVRAVASFNSGVRFGTPEGWEQLITAVRGAGTVARDPDGTRDEWFTTGFTTSVASAGTADRVLADLVGIDLDGYVACCQALAGYDAHRDDLRVRVPGLAVAGTADRATPPTNMREVAALGAAISYAELPGSHLAIVENATAAAALVDGLIRQVSGEAEAVA